MIHTTNQEGTDALRIVLDQAMKEVQALIADADAHLAAGRCDAAAARISASLLTMETARSRLLRQGPRRPPSAKPRPRE